MVREGRVHVHSLRQRLATFSGNFGVGQLVRFCLSDKWKFQVEGF
jgi:hypothetical protein